MKYTLIFSILTFIACSCGSNKVVSPDAAEGRQLIFSHGGGFTGKYNTYYMLENGQLFKNTGTEGVNVPVEGLGDDATTQVFANYDVLNFEDMKIETYGNYLYSITMREGDDSHKISWENGDKGSEILQLFYRNVMNQISLKNANDSGSKQTKIESKF